MHKQIIINPDLPQEFHRNRPDDGWCCKNLADIYTCTRPSPNQRPRLLGCQDFDTHTKIRKNKRILLSSLCKYRKEKIFNIYFRSSAMTLMCAPEEGYLITIATLNMRRETLVDLQSAYINIYADEFSYPSMKCQLQHGLLLQVLVKITK